VLTKIDGIIDAPWDDRGPGSVRLPRERGAGYELPEMVMPAH